MEHVLNATEARVHFGALLRRVTEKGETVVVERGGVPQAVVIGLPEYERLVAKSAGGRWKDKVSAARARVSEELQGRELPAPEEIIQESRNERDEQHDCLR
jgi:prevent-host-death family protein